MTDRTQKKVSEDESTSGGNSDEESNSEFVKKYQEQSKSSTERKLSEVWKKLTLSSPSKVKKVKLDEPTIENFIKYFQEKGFRRIITMVGAGISTSAGIPDFRTPNRGLYDKLSKYDLPYPQAIFEIDYFKKNPTFFYDLAKNLTTTIDFKPTIAHYFVRILEIKGFLLRHYTQNIDGLDRKVGISDEVLVEAHGTFDTSYCMKCQRSYSFEWLKDQMNSVGVPTCLLCNATIKPGIVFFGESLPKKFFQCIAKDFRETDLLIIMGSSLVVEPFASLVKRVDRDCPRVIINDQEVGKKVGINYDRRVNRRDVFIKGTCDEGCMKIIEGMNWKSEYDAFVDEEAKKVAAGLK